MLARSGAMLARAKAARRAAESVRVTHDSHRAECPSPAPVRDPGPRSSRPITTNLERSNEHTACSTHMARPQQPGPT
eukprot:3443736-Prymnesium_polylepis.2